MPWAGLLALALVVAADRRVWGRADLWEALGARLDLLAPALVRVERGIVEDRLGLLRLERAEPEQRRILLMGSSRAQDGFVFDVVPPEFALAKITHAAISPLEVSLFAREAAAAHADLFVLMFSELDTHKPARIVPRAGFADLRVVADLVRHAGPAFLLDERVELERLAVASLLDTYRYHDVLARAWTDETLGFVPGEGGRYPGLVARDLEDPNEVTADLTGLEGVLERLSGGRRRRIAPATINLLTAIRPGDHARLNQYLIERAVRVLRAVGSEVLIVEAPLHPVSYELYDHAATRAEFQAFVGRLRSEQGVHVLTLEESGPYGADDFDDPLHLRPPRGRELGRATLVRAGEILGVEPTFPEAESGRGRPAAPAARRYDARGRPIGEDGKPIRDRASRPEGDR